MSSAITAAVVVGGIGYLSAQDAADTSAGAQRDAAGTTLQATRETNALTQKMYEQGQANQKPYLEAGQQALGKIQSGLGLTPGGTGEFTKTFKPSDLTTDPSYQWRLNQGTQNLNASAAAKGLLGSGQNLKDITDYGQGAASQEYQSAYDRFMNNQSTAYNRLASLAGAGQSTAVGAANQGLQAAGTMGANTMAGTAGANQFMTGAANTTAAGQYGATQTLLNGAGQAFNAYQTYRAGQNANPAPAYNFNTQSQPVDYSLSSGSNFQSLIGGI